MSLDGNLEDSTTTNSTTAVKEIPKPVKDSETDISKAIIGKDVTHAP